MKPFNLKLALEGNPVCGRCGNTVKNFRVRTSEDDKFLIGSSEMCLFVADYLDEHGFYQTLAYTSDGVHNDNYNINYNHLDLFML